MKKIKLWVWYQCERVMNRIEASEGYDWSHMKYYHSNVSFPSYLELTQEWKDLESKYGDWSKAYEAEPTRCDELEDLLA